MASGVVDKYTFLRAVLRKAQIEAKARYENDLLDFVEYMWPVVEPSRPFIRGWVLQAVADHLKAVTDGHIKRLLINVPPGFTKAAVHETPVLTTWGWKRHGDLAVGDYVFAPDGWPTRVIAVSENMVKEAYEVAFDDGTTSVVGGDHLWAVERDVPSVPPGFTRGRKPMVVQTTDLRAQGMHKGKVALRPDRILVSAPIQLPPQHLLIDPYVLGLWLGDGFSGGGEIGVAEEDLANALNYGRVGTVYQAGQANRKQAFYRVTIEDLRVQLRMLGLLNNKHIPNQYMIGSIDQRWSLLQGLMDTDGCAAKTGHCTFSNKNEKLAVQLRELASSLGLKASISSHEARIENTSYGRHFLVSFRPAPDDPVFRLQRKQDKLKKAANKRNRYRRIISVTPVGQREMKCIQVENSLYLIERTFICTHNSLLTDVFWPAWEWGPRRLASNRYVCYSYSSHLTERDNMRCRNVISSDRYQQMWGDICTLSSEQFTKVKFGNTQTGWKLATSVGGIGVGERGDRLIIDDPNDTMDMESEAIRASTKLWFTEVIPDRLNSQEDSAIVIIQQRLHEEDVSGIALSREMGYTHLCVQMYYEPRSYCTGWDGDRIRTFIGEDAEKLHPDKIFWRDPRIDDGDLAWPERFPYEVCEDLRRDKGPTAWTGQYQQSPKTRGGNIIKEEFWKPWEEDRYPNLEYILASLDTAYTEKDTNDPSALTIWGLFRDPNGNPKVILIYAWRKWLEFHKLVETIINTCTVDKRVFKDDDGNLLRRFPVDKIIIEAKSTGISVAQEMMRLYGAQGKFGVEMIDPRKFGDKVARVHAIEHIFSNGLVYAPRRAFADLVMEEMATFPNGRFDDLSDSTSLALRYLREIGLLQHSEEYAEVVTAEMAYPRQQAPLYPC